MTRVHVIGTGLLGTSLGLALRRVGQLARADQMRRTLTTGRVTFWSRSRQEYWRKGDTSGNVQYVHEAHLDCDGDAILVKVEQIGAACNTGTRTCFDSDDLDAVPFMAVAPESSDND